MNSRDILIEDYGPQIIFPHVNNEKEYQEAIYEICHREFERMLIRLQNAKDTNGKYMCMPNDDCLVNIRDMAHRMILNEDKKYPILQS